MIELFPITKTRIQEAERIGFLPRQVGQEYLRFERSVFQIMGIAAADYDGGVWGLFELSNGGFFMAPPSSGKRITVCWQPGSFEGAMSAEAVGIAICLMVLSGLSYESANTQLMTQKFEALHEFAARHDEASEILAFID